MVRNEKLPFRVFREEHLRTKRQHMGRSDPAANVSSAAFSMATPGPVQPDQSIFEPSFGHQSTESSLTLGELLGMVGKVQEVQLI